MTTYVLRRVAQAIPVLFGITLFTFLMIHLVPGDPVLIIAGDKPITEERAAQIRHQYGLDRPLWVQYRDYVVDLLHGDMGSGLHSKRPVSDTIREAMGPTIQLTLAGLLVAVSLGVTLGILAALFHNSWLDTLAMVVALVGVSMPIFYLGLLLLFAFSFNVHLFPATGTGGLKHLVLPAIAVGFASSAYIARLVRSSMLEVLRQDYVVTARAKGLRDRIVITRHALKNALIPVITFLGIQLAGLLTGAVVTETVFSRPGLGGVAVRAINARDFPLIQGTVLVAAVVYVLVNLIVDLSYAIFDPRIRYG
ncbi:MAG: peptide/nickel transport system permease protein [Thermomicrobiales bacterium]|jgi:peptide/nickel transport system permease protein|nr:peptide/nickel transport system permease protein [Thermomicrobiales bacterium]MEA2584139.1 peptide/nickel transport system permease protein [Thermomicrobiales bacterium]